MKKLFEDFSDQSKAEWLAKAIKDLKGKEIESLNWRLNNELVFSPFTHKDDRPSGYDTIPNNKNTNQWEVGAIIKVDDIRDANQQALYLLNKGANALCFNLEQHQTLPNLRQLLADIQLEWISSHFLVQQSLWRQVTENFNTIISEKNLDASSVACSFDVVGNFIFDENEIEYLQSLKKLLPKGRFLSINGISYFDKKENVAIALAQMIKSANAILMRLNDKNLPLKNYINHIQFNISLTDSYFLNIATIRALRLLWQQLLQAWELTLEKSTPIIVHINENTQVADEHYNKIKAGAQAMSAVIGGANRLYVYPSDTLAIGGGTAFSQRIALNVQHLLQMESYLDRVVDPAAGSYYIENMTDKLGESAWMIFKEHLATESQYD